MQTSNVEYGTGSRRDHLEGFTRRELERHLIDTHDYPEVATYKADWLSLREAHRSEHSSA